MQEQQLRKQDFFRVLMTRVDAHFRETKKSKHATTGVVAKTVLLFVSLFGSLAGILIFESIGLSFMCWAIMGFSFALIGMNVSHDALHGGLSANATLNKWLGLSLNLIGGNGYIWTIMHNQVHHTYTNVQGVDDDLEAVPGVRMHPGKPLKKFNRFQHLYVWPMYGFATISWVFMKDYKKFFGKEVGSIKREDHPKKELSILFITKAINVLLFLVLPLIFAPISIGFVFLGFFLAHVIDGMTLGIIFQLAHCVEGPGFPAPGKNKILTLSWAEHQMWTTANFSVGSPVMNFICGGLNYQIEHHLFPKISYGHYPALAPIVKQTAIEYGLPYFEHKTFWKAIASHYRLLKRFGRVENPGIGPIAEALA